ncbi:uncharacterized protein L3040_007993 [Drepanopeziza brunnea f. sp. 'multigermtubi']|uniref:uncharacterized protein n=1 Tax=Drepanopeziza brunnea f. sp. 'multigermtubi' TaxID=698441 RepID=UPI00239EE793|nr:hypothetical protein L3040_007993 [Drepanopeziza brunnea f. sp. 'multigermtubi']
MFGTLKIGSEKNSAEFIEHAKGEAASRLGGYVFSHSACENCRLKKVLKCSYHTAAEGNSSRLKSRSHVPANFSATNGPAGNNNNNNNNNNNKKNNNSAPSPRVNNDASQEIGGWEMAETDPPGSGVNTSSQFSRDLHHVNQSVQSNLNDLPLDLTFDSELEYSENDFNDIISCITGVQPDDMQTQVFSSEVSRELLDAEAFDAMTKTANFMLDDIVASQPASTNAPSPFMAFGHNSPSSPLRQDLDPPAQDESFTASFEAGRARSGTDPSSCQCQRSILRVLAEIESKILSAGPSNIYAILSYQRLTTAASNDILTSRICNCRVQLFGLLGIMGEKITSLSEAIIAAFVCRVKEQSESVEPGGSDAPDKRLDRHSVIRLGEYQVQTLQEFKVVSAAVITLQLNYSVTFVSRTRELAFSMNHLAQAQSLKKLESRLKKLFVKMQQLASDVESDCWDI